MKKYFLLILLMLQVITAAAQEIVIDRIYYFLNGKDAIVTSKPYESGDYAGDVVIPEFIEYNGVKYQITTIGSNAFLNCSNLRSITLPSSITSIGNQSFMGCTSLKSIILPEQLNEIWNNAFQDCKGLTSIEIPKDVKRIDHHAFVGCSSLKSVSFNGAPDISHYVFSNCISLSSITIPEGVKLLDQGLFNNCINLESVQLPKTLTRIGLRAFNDCKSLTSIVIPSSVNYISDEVFWGCSGLESIVVESGNTVYDSRDNCNAIIASKNNRLIVGCQSTVIPNSVESIMYNSFKGCSSLTSIVIPASVKVFEGNPFTNCNGLTSISVDSKNLFFDSRNNCNGIVRKSDKTLIAGCKTTTIPSSVTAIGSNAFEGCTEFDTFTIPNTIKGIGSYAFRGCTRLTSITIPASVEGIGDDAFDGCRLESIVLRNPKTSFSSPFSLATLNHAVLYIPKGTWADVVYGSDWYQFINIREMAAATSELSGTQAYTLMNANSFGYMIYDDVNDEIRTVDAFHQVDESSANSSWQFIRKNTWTYLYNIGAKKYVSLDADGKFVLSAIPVQLDMKNGEKGIILGNNSQMQWNFVLNEKSNVDNSLTAVESLESDSAITSDSYFTLDGRQVAQPHRGVNIVRSANGAARKVVVK